jgi:recombination protein RecT
MTAQTVSSAVARRDKADQLVTWLRRQQDDIAMAAASHVKPAAIVRVTQGALRRNEKLRDAAIANPQSLLYALLDCARLGHEPDTDDYYLVPFGTEVTGIEGYKGIIERMYRAGGVSSVVAQVVRKADRYVPRGENTPPLHEYDDFASPDERGPMKGAYAYAIFPDGHCSQVIRMGRAEIMEHKAVSRGSSRSDSPWQVWEPAMWKKTVLRALEPYVPTSTEYRTQNHAAPAAAEPAVFHRIEHDGGVSSAAEVFEAEIVEDPPAQQPGPTSRPAASSRTRAAGKSARRATRTSTAPERPATSGLTEQETEQEIAAGVPEDEPGSASDDQLTALHITFGGLGFGGGDDDRKRKLKLAETITGRDLGGTSKNLSYTEARKLTDTLDGFGGNQGKLIAHMATLEQDGDSDG